MIGEKRLHAHLADAEVQLFELLNLQVGWHLSQANREERAFHLAAQYPLQPLARAFVAQNAKMVLRSVNRQEKRQPLDMVPMRVRQEQRQVQRPLVKLSNQRLPQRAQSRAGVQNDDLAISADLDTGSVAPVPYCSRAGGGNRAAHPPKSQTSLRWRRGKCTGWASFANLNSASHPRPQNNQLA